MTEEKIFYRACAEEVSRTLISCSSDMRHDHLGYLGMHKCNYEILSDLDSIYKVVSQLCLQTPFVHA